MRYAEGKHILGRHKASEGMESDDDKLEQRVVTLDVETRVRLGEPEFLGAAQGGVVALAVVEHARKNIV